MEPLTADEIEADWKRALDSASEAVHFCAEAKLLTPAYAAREVAIIGDERKWLEHVRPTLRKLFPSSAAQVAAASTPDRRAAGEIEESHLNDEPR